LVFARFLLGLFAILSTNRVLPCSSLLLASRSLPLSLSLSLSTIRLGPYHRVSDTMTRKDTGYTRNPEIARGINKYSRAAAGRKNGQWKKKASEWKQVAKTVATTDATKRTSKWYPTERTPRPILSRKKGKATKTTLRSSITPGTVLIILAGRFSGRRVVFLRQLDSGLLLVTGMFDALVVVLCVPVTFDVTTRETTPYYRYYYYRYYHYYYMIIIHLLVGIPYSTIAIHTPTSLISGVGPYCAHHTNSCVCVCVRVCVQLILYMPFFNACCVLHPITATTYRRITITQPNRLLCSMRLTLFSCL
jgi:hypothetical protein